MLRYWSSSKPARLALLGGMALLICAGKRLDQQPIPAFGGALGATTKLPPGRRVMASGGAEALSAHQTPHGSVVAMAWRSPTDSSAHRRWRYALFPSAGDGAWTWESPAGEPYADLNLGSGDTVDLLVEAREHGAEHPARWIAIDRAQRRPVADGALGGGRCGEVVNVGGDRFVFSVGPRLMFWQKGQGTPTALLDREGPVCLSAARGDSDQRELVWTEGDDAPALWRATVTLGQGQTVSGVERLSWPDAGAPLRLGQELRLRALPEAGFGVVYLARGGQGPDGLREARFDASGASTGPAVQLTDAVGCGGEGQAERWDFVDTEGGPLALRCVASSALTPTSSELPLRALPTSPGLRELALRYDGGGALVCGAQGCDLWSESNVDGARRLVRARLGPVEPLDLDREAKARDLASSAVYGLLHTDAEPESVLALAGRVCITRDSIDRRLGSGVASEGPSTRWIWDEPEGVVTAGFSAATGCLDEVEVRRKPAPRR